MKTGRKNENRAGRRGSPPYQTFSSLITPLSYRLEALLVNALAELDAPRTVGVGDQTLLVSINGQSECLDILFLEAVLMQRLERQNLLEGYVQGAQSVVLGAAQATSNDLLELAQLASRLVLVVHSRILPNRA